MSQQSQKTPTTTLLALESSCHSLMDPSAKQQTPFNNNQSSYSSRPALHEFDEEVMDSSKRRRLNNANNTAANNLSSFPMPARFPSTTQPMNCMFAASNNHLLPQSSGSNGFGGGLSNNGNFNTSGANLTNNFYITGN